MKAFCFFSVHEALFERVALRLRDFGVTTTSGFVWGRQQAAAVEGLQIPESNLLVFTRDLLPNADDGQVPDLSWLEQRERELGVSIQRMLAAERHLLAGRTYAQIMRMAEVALRTIGAKLDELRPDFIFSEDVSCFHSHVHFELAKERGIPFWCVGSGRLPKRLAVYARGMQHWDRVETLYPQLVARGLTADERAAAEEYIIAFRERPRRPDGMQTRAQRPGVAVSDLASFKIAARRFFGDRQDPTMIPPWRVLGRRVQRIARMRASDTMWDDPVAGERYALYPIHYQPEATTLVQAPMFLDQLALIQDIAKSLPVGHRLYVKEHVTNRGRRPLSFYRALRAIPSVRLLGPDEDTFALIRDASIITVITGTVGWEGLFFDKPVVTFGDVYFNMIPSVLKGRETPKDQWYAMFRRAVDDHRPDREALLALVSAMQQSSYPGFMGNSTTFPEVLAPDNVEHVSMALVRELGLDQAKVA